MSDASRNEESSRRIDQLLKTRSLRDAVAGAVENGVASLAAVGLSAKTVLDALEGGAGKLESAASAPALEAIIRLIGRPPLIVRNGRVEIQADLLKDFPPGTSNDISGCDALLGSVGRVEFVNHSSSWGGTGWVIDEKQGYSLVVTNRHVAGIVARRAADGRAVFSRSTFSGARYGAEVDFNEEIDAAPHMAKTVKVEEVTYLADDQSADIALLKIRTAAWGALPSPILLADEEASVNDLVAIIGYPAYDTRNDQTAMEQYFRNLYDIKRFAPGRITQTAASGVIGHDCTSLGGNSGSPIISLKSRRAVGLHFAGKYGVGNSAVSVATLKALLRNPGMVSVGERVKQTLAEGRADGLHKPADLANRDGFDTAFLGQGQLQTPWPTIKDSIARGLARPSDATATRPHELRYTNFGVLFSTELKLPVVTAVNIDGEASVRIKRTDDKWFIDGRIDKDSQFTSAAYADRLIDRGHLVRREDPNWGSLAEQANNDTFHYPNAAPQHGKLNQGKTMWLGLESYILDSARVHGFKACVFTGPVHDEEDPTIEDGMRVPLEFWKVVATVGKDGDTLHATAYLLSQGQLIRTLLEDRRRSEAREGFELGAYQTFQIAIQDLEAAIGYDFGALRDHDPLARNKAGREAIENGDPLVIPLNESADLVL